MKNSNSDNYDDWEIMNYTSANGETTTVPDLTKTFDESLQTKSVSSLTRIPVIGRRLEIENESPKEKNKFNIDKDVDQNFEIDDDDVYQSFESDEEDVFQTSEINENYDPPNFNIITKVIVNNNRQSEKYLLICTDECNCKSKVGESIILVLVLLFFAAITAYFLSGLNKQLTEIKGENYDCKQTQIMDKERLEFINVWNCIFEEDAENENVY